MSLFLRIFLHLLGAGVGAIVWSLAGIGLVELGILPHFDPVGVAEPPPEPATSTAIMEWSLPVFVLAGGWWMPALVGWLTRPPAPVTPP